MVECPSSRRYSVAVTVNLNSEDVGFHLQNKFLIVLRTMRLISRIFQQ